MTIFSRSDRYTCLDCGNVWRVPKSVRRRKRKWRGGGYGYANASSAGVRVMSKAYQGYLSDMKNQRDAAREQDFALASASGVCPNCGSTRHVLNG